MADDDSTDIPNASSSGKRVTLSDVLDAVSDHYGRWEM
jgi:hypothetical protein